MIKVSLEGETMPKLKNVQVGESAHERILVMAELLRTTRVQAASLLIEMADRDAVIARHKAMIDEAAAAAAAPPSGPGSRDASPPHAGGGQAG